jgi:hypothetical protein
MNRPAGTDLDHSPSPIRQDGGSGRTAVETAALRVLCLPFRSEAGQDIIIRFAFRRTKSL